MFALSIKTTKNTISSRNILIHSLFFILGLGYVFYFFPDWYTNRFHIFAPFILAVIDVLAFYLFFTLISVLKKRSLFIIPLLFLVAGLYLYYSSAVNSARMIPTVFKLTEVLLSLNKTWVLATIPRLLLVLGSSLLYISLLRWKIITKGFQKHINLEFTINALAASAFLLLKQPPVPDRDFIEVLVLKMISITLFYSTAFGLSTILFKQKKHLKFLGLLFLSYLVTLGGFLAVVYLKNGSNPIPDYNSLNNFWAIATTAFLIVLIFFTAHFNWLGKIEHMAILNSHYGQKLFSAVNRIFEGLTIIKKTNHAGLIILSSLVLWGFYYCSTMIVLDACGLSLGFVGTGILLVLGSIVIGIPALPGSAGTYDAGIKYSLIMVFNIASDKALTYAIVSHAISYFPLVLVGAVYFMLGNVSLKEVKTIQ